MEDKIKKALKEIGISITKNCCDQIINSSHSRDIEMDYRHIKYLLSKVERCLRMFYLTNSLEKKELMIKIINPIVQELKKLGFVEKKCYFFIFDQHRSGMRMFDQIKNGVKVVCDDYVINGQLFIDYRNDDRAFFTDCGDEKIHGDLVKIKNKNVLLYFNLFYDQSIYEVTKILYENKIIYFHKFKESLLEYKDKNHYIDGIKLETGYNDMRGYTNFQEVINEWEEQYEYAG